MTRRSCVPTATYRLQLHRGFRFADAQAQLDYLVALGASHLYLSPILAARSGSMHGYDVIDHGWINPELGGEAGFEALARAAARQGLGLILDIVPNHMAVGDADNAQWLDVLEHGRDSVFASVFDIDFDSPDPALAGRVLAPILGEPYGQALAGGRLELVWDPAIGKLAVAYGPHRLPIRPRDAETIGGADPGRADLAPWREASALHALLERQNFRLAWWRAAGDAVNWRRFFDVNALAGMRVEDEAVFEQAHAITFHLYTEGLIDGVRIDHIDGLADPAIYLRRLRARLVALNGARPEDAPKDGPYLVVEKILGPGETLPADWPVDGTTGYDFMDQVSQVQHDAAGQAALDRLWAEVSSRGEDFDGEQTRARRETLRADFAGQLAACARAFARLAGADLAARDQTAEGFRRAIAGLIAQLRIYRGYADAASGRLEPEIRRALDQAASLAPADRPALDFIGAALADPHEPAELRAEAVRRLHQLTAPLAAKAVEDTAFYRYSRLISRNDVGFDAARLAISRDEFLALGQARARQWPTAMLTTATHDHKRGEDARARLAVISEIPDVWAEAVREWFASAPVRRGAAIAAEDAYTLFQTLVGAWPPDLAPDDAEALQAFARRISGWRLKSLREAKLRSSWAAPDAEYEDANRRWVEDLLDPARSQDFLRPLHRFVERIAPAGAINALVQTGLRLAWPGAPDLFQGAEFWDLSLVDPDNRRPVDFASRATALREGARDWTRGAVKQALIARLLRMRRSDPELFATGSLEPLPTRGARAGHVLAFQRRAGERRLSMAVVLRAASARLRWGEVPGEDWWGATEIEIEGAWRPAAALFLQSPVFAAAGPTLPPGRG